MVTQTWPKARCVVQAVWLWQRKVARRCKNIVIAWISLDTQDILF